MRDEESTVLFSRRTASGESGDAAHAALRAHLARTLRADLADPVRLDARRRDRCTVMRGIEIRVNRRKRAILVRGRCGPRPLDWLYGRLKLDRPLSGPPWASAWWWCVREELPYEWRALGDDWLATGLPEWINHEARHSGLLLPARRKLIAALRLNPRLLARARALCCNATPDSNHYVIVWRNAHAAKAHLRESPLLWPLYDLTRVSLRFDLDVVKRTLRRQGLTRSGWLTLCRHGRALWWPMRHCHEFKRDPREQIISLANLLGPMGPVLPPAGLLLAVGRLASINRFSGLDAGKLSPPFRAAREHLETLGVHERTAFLLGPVDSVLTEWLLQSDYPSVPFQANWRWFEEWAERSRRESHEQCVPWPSFGRRRRMGDVDFEPLRSLRAVREAGLALRNCMGRAESDDSEHAPSLFLMRAAHGRALAMFSAHAKECGGMVEIRGRHNRDVDSHLQALARAYLHALFNT